MAQIITQNGWWGWWGGWTSYTAWNWIEISAQNEISVDEAVVQTVGNMVDNLTWADDDHYPTAKAVADAISWGWSWDVIWPNSSTDWDIVLFDWATWKIIKDSWVWLSSKLDASALSDNNYWWAWNGDTTHTPTKNALYTKIHTMDVEIWNKAADNTVVKLSWNQVIDWTKQFCISPLVPSKTSAACNCCRDIATEAQVYNVAQDVATINWKIPSAATCSNQLADKDYVNDSINSVTAYYITKNAQGDQFATYAELAAATTFYSGWVQRTPTRNDYTIVLADENHDNATTRYIYNSGWEYQYTVNETALTQAQLDALNSGITSTKVSCYDNCMAQCCDIPTDNCQLSNSCGYTTCTWTLSSCADVVSALWYTPYNSSNPSWYTTCTGTLTSSDIACINWCCLTNWWDICIQSWWITNDTTCTTTCVTWVWAWTEAEYWCIWTKSNSVLYFTF